MKATASCGISRSSRWLARAILENQEMKTKLIILAAIVLTSAVSVMAIITVSFPGWGWLKENSADIIVASCTGDPPQYHPKFEYDSNINVAVVLKGTNNLRSSILRSFYLPQKYGYYLIFSTYHDGSYQALEAYRVIPLGDYFHANLIVGKSLDEQIKILFKLRLGNLERQMKEDQDEKARLEEGIKN
jgi:hypothetical protein